ncbi:MAG: recombinase family protein [Myxococcales bacterium]|nr:recombinase family protein [Myxococcales bacterium]
MKIIGYVRVSTEFQVESGLGLEAQKNACERHALKLGQSLSQIFSDEGLSGALSLEKRPGILSALNILKSGDLLVVAKRDRLGRDPLVLAMIESAVLRKGARIVSAAGEGTDNDDPSSILMRRMIDAFSEYERLIIGARVKSALKVKKERGQLIGRVPFGYKLAHDGIHLEFDEHEQMVLEQLLSLRARGYSIRAIAAHMNNQQVFNRGGTPWNNANVFRILESQKSPTVLRKVSKVTEQENKF